MENALKSLIDNLVVERKLVIVAVLPIAVIIGYALIFKIDLIDVFLSMDPVFVVLFFLSYITQCLILAYRDSMISKVNFFTSFKARLFGNGISLIIPGAAGPDLARAILYTKKGISLDKAFSISLIESFFDVTVVSVMFLILFWLRFSPLLIIFVFVAFFNVAMWIAGFGYVYGTSHETLNRLEQKIFTFKYIKPLERAYLDSKWLIKDRLSNVKMASFYSALTVIGYILQSLPFYLIFSSYLKSIIINITYQVSLLVPIPSAAGAAELALTAIIPPSLVLVVRILELIAYSLGLIFVNDIKFSELREKVKEVWKVS
ncbi:hypothetical protein SacRon12I_00850 [Sulfolobus acidocaldarius Ron12/I]|uniref:Flippase-like domain-containing protein n=1 Tax=Sulfolobus acidocaldarius Ron12/I TaxID=1028567 RepID=M1IZF0_9CREN|nr:hypothetical protein SacRon12I_00850 [Sulfolobus acidocaldarius Ron12/I]WCM34172.1 UPF0104 family protein [Sulfolobus acidocaldarius DSM 639]